VFANTIASDGIVKGIKVKVKGGAKFSRKEIEGLEKFIKDFGARGLAWIKIEGGTIKSPIAKFLDKDAIARLKEGFKAKDGDLILFVADNADIVHRALGELRVHLAKKLKLLNPKEFNFVWVVDFPLFEWNEEKGRLQSRHHPFTAPKPEDLDKLEKEPLAVRSRAYDIVLNGVEIGGGASGFTIVLFRKEFSSYWVLMKRLKKSNSGIF